MSDTKVTPSADQPTCPQCGTPLPTGALAGLCPACLLEMGAATDTVTDVRQPPFNPPTVMELAPLFPQLEILELIGKGGMGAVYKARQKQLDRVVALKILPPGIGDDPAFAERFTREAKALAKLNHPGIVTLYEFGQASGENAALYFFLMEFVDGVNLRQLLQTSRVSAREALAIVPQICDALQFAHDQGVVHRDIKPENILLDRRGRVKVADFGLVKIMGGEKEPAEVGHTAGSPSLTDAGRVMGTPQYMSPEQMNNPGEVDHRADIYALGVVFYQMLTGELPGKKIEPPSRKVSIDVRLDEVVLRALEKKPELRYQQASVLKTEVDTIARSGVAAVPDPKEVQPHFSRTAIVGACWAGLFFLPTIPMAIWALSWRPSEHGGPSFIPFVLTLPLLFGLVGIPGTTILGWVAVSQIRRSAGKLRGLGLAVFDGLLFPLLALDIGIIALDLVGRTSSAPSSLPNVTARMTTMPFPTALLLLLVIGIADWFIIRFVWRAVNKGVVVVAAREPLGKLPPFAFVIAMAYAVTVLFGSLCEFFLGHVPGKWLVAALIIAGTLSLVLAFVLKHHTGEKTQRMFRRVAAGGAFVTALVCLGFTLFILSALADKGGWNPHLEEAVITMLIWFGAVSLPVSFWRLTRGAARWVGAAVFAVFILGGLLLDVSSKNKQTTRRLEREARRNVTELERIAREVAAKTALLNFGPVMERVLDIQQPKEAFLNLANNQLVEPPKTLAPADWANSALREWVTVNQVDVFATINAEYPRLAWCHMEFIIVPNDTWEHTERLGLNALTLFGKSLADQNPIAVLGPGEYPCTVAFKSIRGTAGLLQIIGYTDNLRGVKIRYKLVQSRPAAAATAQREYQFVLPQTSGLGAQAAIVFQGRQVGQVTGIQAHPQGVRVSGVITDPALHVLEGDDARVIVTGMPAVPKLEIVRSSETGRELPVGSLSPGGAAGFSAPVVVEIQHKAQVTKFVALSGLLILGGVGIALLIFAFIKARTGAGKVLVVVVGVFLLGILLLALLAVSYFRIRSAKVMSLQNARQAQIEAEEVMARQAQSMNGETARYRFGADDKTGGGPAFGPVMERVLVDAGAKTGYESLDLRTGNYLSLPQELANQDALVIAWLQTNRVDLFALFDSDPGDSNKIYFACFKTKVSDFSNERWPNATPEECLSALQSGTTLQPDDGTFPEDYSKAGVMVYMPPPAAVQLPRTLAFRTREGVVGLMQITGYTDNPRGVKIRYKLMQNDSARSSVPSPVSTALLAEPPQLRFLAWQEEWKTNSPHGAWHPDGSPVTNVTELDWLKVVGAGGMNTTYESHPRFLKLWISHPNFKRTDYTGIELLDDNGRPLKRGANGESSCSLVEASERNGGLGWRCWNGSPVEGTNFPSHLTVRLSYVTGPLENTREVRPDFNGTMSLEGNSILNGLGQNAEGKAFVSIAVNAPALKSRLFGVTAVTKDGAELQPAGGGRPGYTGSMGAHKFEFPVPLSAVGRFVIGSRPIRTNEWRDVVLRGN